MTRPWDSVIGKVHPDDEDLRVNAAIEWSRWDEGGPTCHADVLLEIANRGEGA